MLFPTPDPRPKAPVVQDPARRARIPTGKARLGESSSDRAARASVARWQALLDGVRRSCDARLELLKGRTGTDRVDCGWRRFSECAVHCRCRGAGTVTIDFLRDHYARLPTEISVLVRRSS